MSRTPVGSMITAEEMAVILTTKLKTITRNQGFETDIGLRVYRGRRQITVEQVPCVVIVEGDDRPASQSVGGMSNLVVLDQHYSFESYLFAVDEDHPNDAAHAAIRDMKRVVFAEDAALARRLKHMHYSGRSIPDREPGTKIVGADVHIDVGYTENLAAP